MPGRFDHCKMAFAECLFQIVHAGDVATIVFGRSGGLRFADYSATVLHVDAVVLGAIGRQQPAPDRAAAPCSLPDHRRTAVVAGHLVVGATGLPAFIHPPTCQSTTTSGECRPQRGRRSSRTGESPVVPSSPRRWRRRRRRRSKIFFSVSLSSLVVDDTTADTEYTEAAVRETRLAKTTLRLAIACPKIFSPRPKTNQYKHLSWVSRSRRLP